MSDKSVAHSAICKELTDLYVKKNHDYGDSFHESFLKWGLTMSAIRLGDKLKRFETLASQRQQVKDESIRDTLIDLANYAIMTVMEIDEDSRPNVKVEQKVCLNCKYYRWMGLASGGYCFGEKDAPRVKPDDTCEDWKPVEVKK